MTARRTFGLSMLAGAIVWAVHFAAAYGLATLVCARGLAASQWAGIGIVDLVTAALTTLALLVLAAVAWRAGRRDGFVDRIALGVCGLAALAIGWEAWLVTRGPPCV